MYICVCMCVWTLTSGVLLTTVKHTPNCHQGDRHHREHPHRSSWEVSDIDILLSLLFRNFCFLGTEISDKMFDEVDIEESDHDG